eukprot:6169701-Amphidinium_carterae.1
MARRVVLQELLCEVVAEVTCAEVRTHTTSLDVCRNMMVTATPPYEVLRLLLSLAMTDREKRTQEPNKMCVLDISRTVLHTATHPQREGCL